MLIDAVIVLLIVMIMGAVPAWPHSRKWGYYPSAGLGILLVIVVVLLLMNIV